MKQPLFPGLFLVLFVVFIILPILAPAQEFKRKGMIVLNNEDTLSGWLHYKTGNHHRERIIFWQDSLAKQGIRYTISDLKAFRIDGYETYRRACVPIAELNDQAASGEGQQIENQSRDTVFLRMLITGKRLELYELFNNSASTYYLRSINPKSLQPLDSLHDENKKGTFELLENRSDPVPPYKLILGHYATQYELYGTLITAIENCHYEAVELASIVAGINQQSGTQKNQDNQIMYQENEYYAPSLKNQPSISWFINIGGGVTRLSPSGYNVFLSGLNYPNSIIPRLSAGIDFSGRHERSRFLFRTELAYSRASYTMSGVSPTSSIDYIQYEIVQSNISPELSVLYHFTERKKWRPYLGLGLLYNLSFYEKNNLKQSLPDNNTLDYLMLQKGWLSGNLKAGLRLNDRWEVYFSGHFFGNYSQNNYFELNPRIYLTNFTFHL